MSYSNVRLFSPGKSIPCSNYVSITQNKTNATETQKKGAVPVSNSNNSITQNSYLVHRRSQSTPIPPW